MQISSKALKPWKIPKKINLGDEFELCAWYLIRNIRHIVFMAFSELTHRVSKQAYKISLQKLKCGLQNIFF